MFSSFSCSPVADDDSFSHEESLPRTVLRKNLLFAAQQEQHFAINPDQNAILDSKNHAMAYANPDLGMEKQLNKLARQKADIGLHSHPIVLTGSTTKGSGRLRQKNVGGKKKPKWRTRNGKQRNISRETKECWRDYNWNRCTKQKRARTRPGTSTRNKRKSFGRQANRGVKQN